MMQRQSILTARATGCAVAFTALFGVASLAGAQSRTKIGATVTGAAVMLETKSVVRANGVVTATLRVLVQPPIKTASGELKSSRTIAMIDCAKQTVATKETWYYFDEAGTKEGLHRKPGIPGFGPATKGSLADVAMKHLCSAAPAKP